MNNILDENEMTVRIENLIGKKENYLTIRKGIREGLEKNPLGSQIIKSIGDEGTYQLVKQYEKDKVEHLIFRLQGAQGINYHDYELIKRNGKIMAADMYIYLVGENLSQIVADVEMEGWNDEIIKEQVEKTTRVQKLLSMGYYQQARDTFLSIPISTRGNKIVMLLDIETSMGVNDTEALNSATRKYMYKYAQDPCVYLTLLNADFINRDYLKAINDIDSLDRLINKDPFLDYFRGLTYKMLVMQDSAQACFERLKSNMPDFENAYIELIVSYMNTSQYDKAKEIAKVYKQKIKNNKLELLIEKHPEYKQYLE
jgi:tetratricopeptide (TPR) repeat protein